MTTIDPALLDAPALTPVDQSQTLEPHTPVVIQHRGGPNIVEKYDGREYVVPFGRWTLPYEVAQHLKARAIVPGSRNPYSGKTASRIGIVATTYGKPVDAPEKCRVFTAEELKRFGEAVEGLDRSAVESAGGQQVELVTTNAVVAAVHAKGFNVDARLEAPTDPAALAAVDASENAVLREAYADAGEAQPGGRRRR